MPVMVKFPDGAMRAVNSYPKIIPSNQLGGGEPRVFQVSLDDEQYTYVAVIGGFLARARA